MTSNTQHTDVHKHTNAMPARANTRTERERARARKSERERRTRTPARVAEEVILTARASFANSHSLPKPESPALGILAIAPRNHAIVQVHVQLCERAREVCGSVCVCAYTHTICSRSITGNRDEKDEGTKFVGEFGIQYGTRPAVQRQTLFDAAPPAPRAHTYPPTLDTREAPPHCTRR